MAGSVNRHIKWLHGISDLVLFPEPAMRRLDPFDIHSLIPLGKTIPDSIVWALLDAFHRALEAAGHPLSRDEASLLDGLIRITYLQASFDGHKPSLGELLKICGQAASDETDSLFRKSLLVLGAKISRTYLPPRTKQMATS